MKIVKYPTYYAPASGEVNFQISAEIDELIEIEILAGDDNTLIGKKRFRNATLYNVNVAGYARRQIDVTPQRPSSISFAQPANRLSKITIRSGSVQGSTVVAAGNNPLDSYIKLSASPETIPRTRSIGRRRPSPERRSPSTRSKWRQNTNHHRHSRGRWTINNLS